MERNKNRDCDVTSQRGHETLNLLETLNMKNAMENVGTRQRGLQRTETDAALKLEIF